MRRRAIGRSSGGGENKEPQPTRPTGAVRGFLGLGHRDTGEEVKLFEGESSSRHGDLDSIFARLDGPGTTSQVISLNLTAYAHLALNSCTALPPVCHSRSTQGIQLGANNPLCLGHNRTRRGSIIACSILPNQIRLQQLQDRSAGQSKQSSLNVESDSEEPSGPSKWFRRK